MAYTPRKFPVGERTKGVVPGQIYLCDRIDDQEPDRFRWILCHELFHYVDDEAGTNYIIDHGYAYEAMTLPHALRLQNAETFALFTMHAAIGRPRMVHMEPTLQPFL